MIDMRIHSDIVQTLASVFSVNIAELRVENRSLDTARGSALLPRYGMTTQYLSQSKFSYFRIRTLFSSRNLKL